LFGTSVALFLLCFSTLLMAPASSAAVVHRSAVAAPIVTAVPAISINDVSVNEGDSGSIGAIFSVTLSITSTQTITVKYSTSDGTAKSSQDYTSIGLTTLTFLPGDQIKNVTVQVKGDTVNEADETFFVNLSGASANAVIADSQGQGTIIDNDPQPSLSIGNSTVTETNSGVVNASFTVSLSKASGRTVTVDYQTADSTTTAGSDYLPASGTLTFLPGTTSQKITVQVIGDTIDEDNEIYFVNLSNAIGATILDGQGQGTITDNDSAPSISINDVRVGEGNSGTTNAVFTASLSSASGKPITVAYATANGTATAGSDYLAASGTLTFAPGTVTQPISVTVIGDTLVEGDETVLVNLSKQTNSTIADKQGVGTIVDDELQTTISISDTTVPEGNAGPVDATFIVTLSAPSSQPVTVDYHTTDGTATAGSDYEAKSGTVTFPANSTTQIITIRTTGDTINEDNETFFVSLSNASANAIIADAQGQGTINDNDPLPTISIGDVTIQEPASGVANATFLVTLSAASGKTVTVNYATANNTALNGSDYGARSGVLTFLPSVISQQVTIPVNTDSVTEPNETFFVNLSVPVNGVIQDGQGVGTILDLGTAPQLNKHVFLALVLR